jgi:hypothetical protein
VQERNSLSFSAKAWFLVNEFYARSATAVQRGIEIVHGKADVMNAGSALGHVPRDRGIGIVSLKELDQRLAGIQAHYVRPVRILEWNLGQPQDIAEKRKALGECLHSDSDMC